MTSNAMIARKSETIIAVIMLDVATFARSLLWHIFDSAMTVAELIRHNGNKGIADSRLLGLHSHIHYCRVCSLLSILVSILLILLQPLS
jgi:hypothetical protein